LKKEWSLSARPGHLRLYGGCYDLSSPESPTMLLRKQTAFHQTFQTVLDFKPRKEGYEAGIVVWWNMHSFASIGIKKVSNGAGAKKKAIILREPTETIGVMKASFEMFYVRSLRAKIWHRIHFRVSTQKGRSLWSFRPAI